MIGLGDNKDDQVFILSDLEFAVFLVNFKTNSKTPDELHKIIKSKVFLIKTIIFIKI